MVVVDRQVIRHGLAAEHAERIDAAERDDASDARVARGFQHVPVTCHVVRDEALAGIGSIRPLPTRGVDDRVASAGRGRVVVRIENVVTIGNVKSNDLIALRRQMLHHGAADQAAASAHQHTHVASLQSQSALQVKTAGVPPVCTNTSVSSLA